MPPNTQDVYNLLKNTIPALIANNNLKTEIELLKKDLESRPTEIQVNNKISEALSEYKKEDEKKSGKWVNIITATIIAVLTSLITALTVKGAG